MSQIRSLVVSAPGALNFASWHEAPKPGGFFARTIVSGISIGTETTYVRGDHPAFELSWDWQSRVFRGAPAEIFPIRSLGYMEVAEIVDSRRPDLVPGTLVAMSYGHRTGIEAEQSEPAILLPSSLDPVLGVYVATLGPVAANGLLHAAALSSPEVSSLGDGIRGTNVVVLGAGAVGLLITLFALEYGASAVLVVDRNTSRLEVAQELGAMTANDIELDIVSLCKQSFGSIPEDKGADIVFQTRPAPYSLSTALKCLRTGGTVIDLAFYTTDSRGVWLGHEFHHNGLRIVSAQIENLPRSAKDWSKARLSQETIALLLKHSSFIRRNFITSTCEFDEAPQKLHRLKDANSEITPVIRF